MRNRAKCKKCQSIIESYTISDYVTCKCGEIAIDGGQIDLKVYAVDFNNFMRVDDQDNEIIVKVKEKNELEEKKEKPSKTELLVLLDEMINNIEKLPSNAMSTPISHYDFVSALLLFSSILKCKDE